MIVFYGEKEHGIETGISVPTRLVQWYAWWVITLCALVQCLLSSPHGQPVHIEPPHVSPVKGYIPE